MRPRLSFAAAVCALVACAEAATDLPPYGQLVLYVDTDAPLPVPPGESIADTDAPALFDRLRIDVYRPGESAPCADCTHEFALDRTLVAEARASVGITPPVGMTGYTARVRLFRADAVERADPRADATVESFVALPAISAEGVTRVTVNLRTEDLARPRGTRDAPIAVEPGPPPAGFSGSWSKAHRTTCVGEAGPGEVCVPGGAYWMGHPAAAFMEDSVVLRIAAVDAFFLADREVTVGDFRRSGLAIATDPVRYLVEAGQDVASQFPCTYTDSSGNYEDLPVTCVSYDLAREYCQRLHADLPTEAQLQYVLGSLASRKFVWGDDSPTCGDSVFARARQVDPIVRCPGSWLDSAGRGARDRLMLPGGVILDLAGNVRELALDVYNASAESCWGTGVFMNPLCDTPSSIPGEAGAHTIIGGSWTDPGSATSAMARGSLPPFATALKQRDKFAMTVASTGFRCARPAK